jgi:hypothetical protein
MEVKSRWFNETRQCLLNKQRLFVSFSYKNQTCYADIFVFECKYVCIINICAIRLKESVL